MQARDCTKSITTILSLALTFRYQPKISLNMVAWSVSPTSCSAADLENYLKASAVSSALTLAGFIRSTLVFYLNRQRLWLSCHAVASLGYLRLTLVSYWPHHLLHKLNYFRLAIVAMQKKCLKPLIPTV